MRPITSRPSMGAPTTQASTPTSGASGASGLVTAGVISGLTDIANGFVTAQRKKNIANFNAKMAELQGRMNRISANKVISDIRKRADLLYSAQTASYAKSGIALSGSPIDVMLESHKESEIDVIYEEISADYAGSGYQAQSAIYKLNRQNANYDMAQDTMKSILTINNKKLKRG